jgi:SAM-dependent methyltransferase
MEATIRKPFQGVMNIIRFNWHFYVFAGAIVIILLFSLAFIPETFSWVAGSTAILICFSTLLSLAVSCYVYDYADLYGFAWLVHWKIKPGAKIVNINAGFDETSPLLKSRYPEADLEVLDFYNPARHTEISIERARRAYAAYPGTTPIDTGHIPLERKSVDFIFNIFAIHEVRNSAERIDFLRQQYDVLKEDGRCIVMEHLRDLPNLMAYNIGFFHFFSRNEWCSNFSAAGFQIEKVLKITPFVSIFVLKKNNGVTP